MKHDWTPSKLGHGDTMCRRCFITNREAAALGVMNECDVPEPPPPSSNDNTSAQRAWTQDEIDEEMFCDDDEEDDQSAECGRWNGGYLTRQCRLAGSEWCDWDCPIGC